MNGQLTPNTELRFWRTKAGHEIDFVLLKNRKPFLIEVKSRITKMEVPAAMRIFIKHYPETIGGVVFTESIEGKLEWIGKKIQFLTYDRVNDLVAWV